MMGYESYGARLLRQYAEKNPSRVVWDQQRGWLDQTDETESEQTR